MDLEMSQPSINGEDVKEDGDLLLLRPTSASTTSVTFPSSATPAESNGSCASAPGNLLLLRVPSPMGNGGADTPSPLMDTAEPETHQDQQHGGSCRPEEKTIQPMPRDQPAADNGFGSKKQRRRKPEGRQWPSRK